ncbi:MAG: 50S ribosomal protein L10, partial [Candidatus Ratteibacteria bacterium]
KNSKINILGSFSNITVLEMQKIRDSIKELGGNVMVVKNNLINIVFQNLSKDEVCKFINGPSFVIWSSKENEIEIIKSVLRFQKDTGKIEIKGGLLNGEVIGKDKISQLGELPGKKELQGMVITMIKMPTVRLISSLKSPMTKVVNILNQIKSKKES